MRHFLLFIFLLWSAAESDLLQAQPKKDTATTLLRIYEDNDFINIYLKGTDNAYTNGTRIDLFHTKKSRPHFFLDRLMPKAGDSSIDVYGWGIAQLMYTPNDIATKDYQPGDYPYAGALFATHTLYSYNATKKYDLQTEFVVGVSGPASFARQTQAFVHRVINYQQPMGWDHQAKNALLLNLDVTVEKQLAGYHGWLELIGGSGVSAGTMYNAVSVYPELRIGSMSPYFNGYISQYSKSRKAKNRLQAYMFVKAQPLLVFSDELLQGRASETVPKNSKAADARDKEDRPYNGINRFVYYFSYGAVATSGHFSISFTQTSQTALIKDLYGHDFGNISFYFSW